ncbi:hypothetical protein AYI70_g1158 [Smittium culicis]|uniref:Uncharacterized protein n=1 Tax=Smittium culicis TaxID=133412 RepID=A0A1R1YE25_9FUNG|nr:hypothetical protein AYI70_g1158 [Smittium culicis]
MDISPVIELFREWRKNSSLTVKKITTKLCWMLSVSGFLYASGIHRIDDQHSHIEKGVLYLAIVVPKEKRGCRPVEKPCQINPHEDIVLYPSKCVHGLQRKGGIQSLPNSPH